MRELEIALPQWPIDFIREPQLEIEDILAVQGLLMGYLRKRARKPRYNYETKSHYLVMLDHDGPDETDEVYDGSTDTYMTCKVQKNRPDEWRMLVSFLGIVNTEATNMISTREMYRFNWLSNGNRQAWYTSVTRRCLDEDLSSVQVNAARPIDSDECLQLQNRMLATSQAVNPLTTDSIFVPKSST